MKAVTYDGYSRTDKRALNRFSNAVQKDCIQYFRKNYQNILEEFDKVTPHSRIILASSTSSKLGHLLFKRITDYLTTLPRKDADNAIGLLVTEMSSNIELAITYPFYDDYVTSGDSLQLLSILEMLDIFKANLDCKKLIEDCYTDIFNNHTCELQVTPTGGILSSSNPLLDTRNFLMKQLLCKTRLGHILHKSEETLNEFLESHNNKDFSEILKTETSIFGIPLLVSKFYEKEVEEVSLTDMEVFINAYTHEYCAIHASVISVLTTFLNKQLERDLESITKTSKTLTDSLNRKLDKKTRQIAKLTTELVNLKKSQNNLQNDKALEEANALIKILESKNIKLKSRIETLERQNIIPKAVRTTNITYTERPVREDSTPKENLFNIENALQELQSYKISVLGGPPRFSTKIHSFLPNAKVFDKTTKFGSINLGNSEVLVIYSNIVGHARTEQAEIQAKKVNARTINVNSTNKELFVEELYTKLIKVD